MITFADDDRRLWCAHRDLERLGFTDDLVKLHPAHPEHVSLAGKRVHVRPREWQGGIYWNLAAPPAPADLDAIRRAMSGIQAKSSAIRAKLQGKENPRPDDHTSSQKHEGDR